MGNIQLCGGLEACGDIEASNELVIYGDYFDSDTRSLINIMSVANITFRLETIPTMP